MKDKIVPRFYSGLILLATPAQLKAPSYLIGVGPVELPGQAPWNNRDSRQIELGLKKYLINLLTQPLFESKLMAKIQFEVLIPAPGNTFIMKKRKRNKTQNEIGSFLGKNIKFEGDLKFSGAIRIEGHVKGSISGEGTLLIDIDGKVESDIMVSNVINYGEIHGNIIAEKKIDLRASGIVFGNIKAPVIEIEEGATFQGNCQTDQIKQVDGKKRPVIDYIKPES